MMGLDTTYVAVITCSLSWRDQPSTMGQHVEIAMDVVDDHGLRRLSYSWRHEPWWFMRWKSRDGQHGHFGDVGARENLRCCVMVSSRMIVV